MKRAKALLTPVASVLLGSLLVAGLIEAATTISTSISTGGTISTTGALASNYASTTVLSINNFAYFGGTGTTTINAAGDLYVNGSTTLQTFTATQGTLASGTTTNSYPTNLLVSGSSTLQAVAFVNATSTGNGGSIALTSSNTATSTLRVGCIQTTATSSATPVRIVLSPTIYSTSTFQTANNAQQGAVFWQFGTCPI